MPAPSLLSSLVRTLVIGALIAGSHAQASEPKAAPADDAKSAKSAKTAAAPEEGKSAKGTVKPLASVEDAKPGKPAKAAHADEEAKPAKAGKHGEAAPSGTAKAGTRPAEQTEAARLEDLGVKIAEKLAKAKAPDGGSPGALVIRVKSPERAAGSGHGAPAPVSAHGRSAPQPELHALVLAASQREASRAAPAAGAPAGNGHGDSHAAHWSYTGEAGPQNWARLKPEFAKCAEGARQSPINIRGGIKVDLEPIGFEYRPSTFSVIDNGHTVQVNVDSGNAITIMGRRYELVQFHFHRPAEERVDGRVYDMVAHLVHKDPDGRLAVIAVLMDRGQAHPMIQTVWNNLPLERGEEIGGTAQINLAALLPANRTYYTYMGSLTTPPCSEGVLWMVMKEPVQVSTEQIAIFSRLYPMNARPLQAMSGRLIKESN